jgi:rhodanese-related sulfurtransferase
MVKEPDSSHSVQGVGPEEAERLVREQRVRVLDVRTPEEYRDLGHIPGAILLPVDLIAAGPATIPFEGKPLLVCCEHGVRSAAAARFLIAAGFKGVLNLSGGLSRWRGPRELSAGDPGHPAGPSSWLVKNAALLPPGGNALDVACGAGRNALLLAAAGFRVRAVDRDERKIQSLDRTARKLGLPLSAEILDLESAATDLGDSLYDLVLVTRYLHRPLFPALIRALRQGGLLLYETFTEEHGRRGGPPTRREYLLGPGELRRLVAPLEILREREGEFDGGFVSGVAARRLPSP